MDEKDSKKIISDVIQRLMVILGPEVTLLKVRSLPGLTLSEKDEVKVLLGEPEALLIKILKLFVPLSPFAVAKTLEYLSLRYPEIQIEDKVFT